jgi:hypothetical protein
MPCNMLPCKWMQHVYQIVQVEQQHTVDECTSMPGDRAVGGPARFMQSTGS